MKSWLNKLKEIYDGWKNDIFPTDDILDMAESRANICAGCPLNVNNVCSKKKSGVAVKSFIDNKGNQIIEGQTYKGCGCPLDKKTKSETSKCPLGRW